MLGLGHHEDLANACFSNGVTPVVGLAHWDQMLTNAKLYYQCNEGLKIDGRITVHLVKNNAVPLDPTNYSDGQAALRC